MRYPVLVALLGSVTLATTANATPSAGDFVKKVSGANQFEIQSSQLALEKSKNEAIEHFAQQMVDDHTEASGKLATTLEEGKVSATPLDDVDTKHAKILAKLDATHGKDFDKEYITLQMAAHKEAVALFSDYAANGKDPALKKFAQDMLPTLKQHLQHVKELSAK